MPCAQYLSELTKGHFREKKKLNSYCDNHTITMPN
jgi:hypothetical protein